jgi:hypothetical protein
LKKRFDQLLDKYEMDWAQKEQFADFLIGYSKEINMIFLQRNHVYNHIQLDE